MDRHTSHVSPAVNITIQAEREPEDSPASPSNPHELSDGGSYPSSPVRPGRRGPRERLAPYPASRGQISGSRSRSSSGRTSQARSASSAGSDGYIHSGHGSPEPSIGQDSAPRVDQQAPLAGEDEHRLFTSHEWDAGQTGSTNLDAVSAAIRALDLLRRNEVGGKGVSRSSAQSDAGTIIGSEASSEKLSHQSEYLSGPDEANRLLQVPDEGSRRGKKATRKLSKHLQPGTQDSKGSKSKQATTWELGGLETAALDLALGLTAFNLESQDDDWATRYRQAVQNAARTSQSNGGRLDPETQKTLQVILNNCGFRELPTDEKTQNMILANRPILMTAEESKSPLERVVQQHLTAAEYLLAQKPLWRSVQADEELKGLHTEYENWKRLPSEAPQRDTPLMGTLISGPGRKLRARMWSALGWSRTTTFNSRARKQDTGTGVTATVTSDIRDELRQASIDEATAMLASVLTSGRDPVQLKDRAPQSYCSLSHMIQSLSLFRTNWKQGHWDEEGRTIALVRLQDEIGQVSDRLVPLALHALRANIESQGQVDDKLLLDTMKLHNLRMLHGTKSAGRGNKLAWQRIATQVSINAEVLRREISYLQRPPLFEAGTKILMGIQRPSDTLDTVLDALTKPMDVVAMRHFVRSHLSNDWTMGWHLEPILAEGDDQPLSFP